MNLQMWALVMGCAASVLALICLCTTIYIIVKPPRDTDVEQLADEVAKLTRRSRADTMRRVRAETASNPVAPSPDITVPPELQAQIDASRHTIDPRTVKHDLRRKLLNH